MASVCKNATKLVGFDVDLSVPPANNLIPSSKPCKYSNKIVIGIESNKLHLSDGAITSDNPFKSQIIFASWLTQPVPSDSWSEGRNVFTVTFSIKNSSIAYNPGDSIGLYAQNTTEIVQELLAYLQEAHSDITNLNLSTVIANEGLPPGFLRPGETSITLGSLLTSR